MKDYIDECKNSINPFATNREYPNRLSPSPFAKKPKTTPTKRGHTETKFNIKKLCKPRTVDRRCTERFQYNGLAQGKTAETMHQNSTLVQPAVVAIPIQQAATTVTYAQPVLIPATVPTQPVVTTSGQPQKVQQFCALCTPIGIQCQNNYLMPLHPECSDPEEEEEGL